MNVFSKELGDLNGLDAERSIASLAAFLSYLQENTDYQFGRLDDGIGDTGQRLAALERRVRTLEEG